VFLTLHGVVSQNSSRNELEGKGGQKLKMDKIKIRKG
jgi:hypothetical protein